MGFLSDKEERELPKAGLLLIQVLILALFVVFGLRLWFLQVHKGEQFSQLAKANQQATQTIYAPRGLLRDRNGVLLAINEPSYALAMVREDVKDMGATLEQVSQWTGVEVEQLKQRILDGRYSGIKSFEQLTLVPDISFEQLAVIESNTAFWPGLEIVVQPKRYYPHTPYLTHILGYVDEADKEDMKEDEYLALGDVVGKNGVELVFEKRLRGSKGEKQVVVDATGRGLTETISSYPEAGENLRLSIDLRLQEFISDQLRGEAGGVVVLEPYTGQVLALVTEPTYDNNIYSGILPKAVWDAVRLHPRKPQQNRPIQSMYPPGSVWKLLMAAAALDSGLVSVKDTFSCPGFYQVGKTTFRCWKGGGHGSVDMRKALVQSCDVYFYKVGEKLGIDRISEYALASGYGKLTGIDLPSEYPGLVPTRDWKKRKKDESWQVGDTINMSIGQGFTLVTPLQTARFLASLVNGGEILKPNILYDAPKEVQGMLQLTGEQREFILDAMVDTVTEGTCRRIYRDDAVIGGKTGTAQVVRIGSNRKRAEDTVYKHRDHAWMASWGKKGDKAYVVVAMVEHGGHGSSAAGPIVKAIYGYLFDEPETQP